MRAILFISILLINNTVLNAQTWQDRYQQLVDKGDELYFEYKYDEAVPLLKKHIQFPPSICLWMKCITQPFHLY